MKKPKQLELFPEIQTPVSRVEMNVRIGRIDTRHLHVSDIDRFIGPHGEAAQDAFERDLAMDDDNLDDGGSEGEW